MRRLVGCDEPAEGVLCARGIALEGRKSCSGSRWARESYDSWLSFGRDLVAWGMRAPALIVADRAPGMEGGR